MRPMRMVIPNMRYEDEVIKVLNEYTEKLREGRLEGRTELILDFVGVKYALPYPMLLVGVFLRKLKINNPEITVSYINVENTYLKNVGFFKFIERLERRNGSGGIYHSETHQPITCITREDVLNVMRSHNFESIGEASTFLTKGLATILSHGQNEFFDSLNFMCREIVRNTFEHSDSDEVYICAQYWSVDDEVDIAIIDSGQGLLKSLSSNGNHKSYILNDEDGVKYALSPGISKSFTRYKNPEKIDSVWGNSGFGLYVTSYICARLGGSFILGSGKSMCKIQCSHNDEVIYLFGDFDYAGCCVRMRINVKSLNSFEAVRQEALEKGIEISKGMKNTFTEPSGSSRV